MDRHGMTRRGMSAAWLLCAVAAGAGVRLAAEPAASPEPAAPASPDLSIPTGPEAEAKMKRLGEIVRAMTDLSRQAQKDPELRKDPKTLERVEALKKEGDGLMKDLTGGVRAREDVIIGAVIGKYVPELKAEMERARSRAIEVNAAVTLKNMVSAEALMRMDDQDHNEKNDYWVADLSGLARLKPKADGPAIDLIDRETALADARPCVPLEKEGVFKTKPEAESRTLVALGKGTAKRGYWFAALEGHAEKDGPVPYDDGSGRNPERFGFCAYPAEYGKAGRLTFIISETGALLQKDTEGKPPRWFPLDPDKEGWEPMGGRRPPGDAVPPPPVPPNAPPPAPEPK